MCGIGLAVSLDEQRVPHLRSALAGMRELLAHRGPDGEGEWVHPKEFVGFANRRLKVIDLEKGAQPMTDGAGNWITYNGEIYNYLELRTELGRRLFRTHSDTEVILHAYRRWGLGCLDRLRGMFAFALWDEAAERLVVARDRFGIKPLYTTVVDRILYCASEAKVIVPFLHKIETDTAGLRDYLTFQFPLAGKTLFAGIEEIPPGHVLIVERGEMKLVRWWEVHYEPDLDHTDRYFIERLRHVVLDSVDQHLRADVPVGAYLSGGLDSSIISAIAARAQGGDGFIAFTGRFEEGPAYDESGFASAVAQAESFDLRVATIGPSEFVETMGDLAYFLDFPVAGPGSFPQYIVSRMASKERKVVLGGQGGDEIFGGYARYLVAYFEQCIKAAIEGTMDTAPFIVTYESIIPNLASLREYKPLIQELWRDGVFGDLDERYFRLVNRAPAVDGAIDWSFFGEYSPLETFLSIFRADNVGKESYFDRMTHFDFKTLLPALLQVEDRVSMAHGLESRTPFVDHEVVEFAATLPALFKFKGGELKRSLKLAFADLLPAAVSSRRDKMGFPVPLTDWFQGPLRHYLLDNFAGASARREYLDPRFSAERLIDGETGFGRTVWGLFALELWQQNYHDRAAHWRDLGRRMTVPDRERASLNAEVP
jgi:asparagine synthase (glutamine-hydrolysing)